MSAEQTIRRFSTWGVPQEMRLDYWLSSISSVTWPVTDWSGISSDFEVDLQEARLGCISTVLENMRGAPHARRTRADVDNSAESCYSLFLSSTPSYWAHNGHSQNLLPGDVVLIGQGEHDSYMECSGFQGNILKLPTHWLQSWVPDPDGLAGRAISKDSRWGRVLSPMISQLTPALAEDPPLPPGVLVDQLGATLALIAGEADTPRLSELFERIQDCISERCSEPQLTAADVAASLNVAPRILHRVLAAKRLGFAGLLVDSRVEKARHMLTSSSFARLTITEIASRAGFISASAFARLVRKRTGHPPRVLRRLVR
jgi:AraC-like DNA-binding protein